MPMEEGGGEKGSLKIAERPRVGEGGRERITSRKPERDSPIGDKRSKKGTYSKEAIRVILSSQA